MKPEAKIKRPGVGLAGIIMKDRKVLLGFRKGSHGSGSWSFPGGHIEMFERFYDSLIREIEEETGLGKGNVEFLDDYPCAVTNDFFKDEGKHYVTLCFRLQYLDGEVENLELEKCAEWRWCDWDDLPSPLFETLKNLKKRDYNPFR